MGHKVVNQFRWRSQNIACDGRPGSWSLLFDDDASVGLAVGRPEIGVLAEVSALDDGEVAEGGKLEVAFVLDI